MKQIGIVGAGWRAEMWISVIEKTKLCRLAGVLCRSDARAQALSERGVRTVRSMQELLSLGCDAVLVCVSKGENCAVTEQLLSCGARVLCETPAGMNDEEGARLGAYGADRLQFAEQFPLHPRFQALAAYLRTGALGRVHTLALSCCHGYHAAALMRALLMTGDALPEVRSLRLADAYAQVQWRGEARSGVASNERTLAVLTFGDRTALYDFSHAQYFSPVRGERFLVQGTLGELSERGGTRLAEGEAVPVAWDARFGGQGCDLGAPDLMGLCIGGVPVYRNPFYGSRLSEEEIAMAHCLVRALAAFGGGERGYPAAEAALDARIARMM